MIKFFLKSRFDDVLLATELYRPEGVNPKALVQIVHGMCEHKERYRPFVEFLVENGYAVVIHDQRGHGESVKKNKDLGYLYNGGWNALVEDMKDILEYARSILPDGLPVCVLGHSMGSMVARSYLKRYDSTINTMILSGSPSDNPLKGRARVFASICSALLGAHCRPKILHKKSFGEFNLAFRNEEFPNAWVCSDPDVQEAYHNDPLCNFRFTANGFKNLFLLMEDCYSVEGWEPQNPAVPVYFLSGAEDPCRVDDISLENAVNNIKRAGYQRVTFKMYPKMRHEILNEKDKQTVWNDILNILQQ